MKKEFMEEAIELALDNVKTNTGGPFGAVIVKDDKVIGKGANSVTGTCDPTAHAEILAIKEACQHLNDFKLTGCEIYTSCEPCPMCLAALYWARIDKIYYACTQDDAAKVCMDDSTFYKELSLPKEKRQLPMEQLLREEAQAVFEAWEKSEEKVEY